MDIELELAMRKVEQSLATLGYKWIECWSPRERPKLKKEIWGHIMYMRGLKIKAKTTREKQTINRMVKKWSELHRSLKA